MELFVIGNGFDLGHNLETTYSDFRDYLENTNEVFLMELEQMYGFSNDSDKKLVKEYLWKDFENNLSSIEETNIIEAGETIDLGLEIEDMGIEDTLSSHWENQYGFIKELNEFVMSWIGEIDINIPKKTKLINKCKDDMFITFNYTLVLEKVYGIDTSKILHIHGSIEEDDLDPVIGHGNKQKVIENRQIAYEAREQFYEKKCSIYNAIANYYERTLKNVESFIGINNYFFRELKNINTISIIGHSLGDVDIPYFKEIKNYVNKNTIWKFYCYDENNSEYYKKKLMSIGIDSNNIIIKKSCDFFCK
ncbi:bacteriophage abortive infection AbiH family protein [Clostridium thermobutyricum]|uniref:bacteriophage abortive infection AbiH family protein n=1 Tax=Clostridium thermobutyricum TaxID=29372 RepID=UPI0018A979E7|nr:bacteriophage abortive infection AbiH family protein [Clostridium thermobutyricum]